ncbi:DNA mismatch repair endonuclease MutL [Gemmatimonas sp.]|uniref:DNA mismatch repair endonuclease MutL n=1 Tax=Gemmatimonas sp. TaxID=1962908 RepID=UPI0022CCE696|nr:DNA mismatch repair endonuclease MutL [Gemmatimonas sp.]MCZ8204487.1 DNA mismatch repair endonuclease MutL [Gemmatimonas sp.]
MSRIAVLPTAVADQIAAGEVVERPASVVKELVENALDAGATTVDVTVEDGGRALIRIADDGSGMDSIDAVLALSRHATSKISSAEQLVGVRSFGFRGEALPAIASVSELQIETAPEDGAGTLVRVAGGALQETRAAARRRGTTVSVHRLFFNTPARQKFLRSARSEWRGILDTMHAIATLRRDVHFVLRHDGKVALDLPAVPTLRTRLAALWGARELERFVDVDDVQGPVHVTGLVERPADVGTASRRVLLVVNGRLVRDFGLVRAAEAAYKSTLPAGMRPSVVLLVHVPGADVDVNVHPAKAEVRFRDRWPIERAVEQAVRRALGLFEASADIGGWRSWSPSGATSTAWRSAPVWLEPAALRAPQAPDGLFAPHDAAAAPAFDTPPWESLTEDVGGVGTPAPAPHESDAVLTAPPEPVAVPPLMQLRRTYLMFEHDDGVILIDQHSAHERVLYEQFLGVLERGEAPSQRLLFPMTLHLAPAESEAFESSRDLFVKLGFEIEHFGGHTLLVNAVPMPHPRFDAERCLRDTLAAMTGDRVPSTQARHERLAATFACKAAIKAGDTLSPGEMRALYVALADTRLAAHDVHGRSTIVRLSWDELDRRFGRK